MRIVGILASGQTGAARGALDVAMARGLQAAGWWPRLLQPEDGAMPARYAFLGRHGENWKECHLRMLAEAHVAIIFEAFPRRGGHDAERAGILHAHASGKPFCVVSLVQGREMARRQLGRWLSQLRRAVGKQRRYAEAWMLVRGPKESRVPGIAEDVRVVLGSALDDWNDMPRKDVGFDDLTQLTGHKVGQYKHKQTGQLFYARRRRGSYRGKPQPYSCAVKGCKNPVTHREMKGQFWRNGCLEHVVVPDVLPDDAVLAIG